MKVWSSWKFIKFVIQWLFSNMLVMVWDISFQIQIVICHLQLIHIFILQKREDFDYPASAGWVQH